MRIYVGNLSYDVSEDDLRTAFAAFGSVEEVIIVKDRYSGRSKGFGFVTMSGDEEAQKAIDGLNGTEIKGRSITVNKARPREERPRRSNDSSRGRDRY